MYTITKTFHFAAAHALPHLPDGHKCQRLHGHNYQVTYELAARVLGPEQWVTDYAAIKKVWSQAEAILDHRNLNDIIGEYSTAEMLAGWLFELAREQLDQLVAVTVHETPNTSASYRP